MKKIGERFGYIPEKVFQMEVSEAVQLFPTILEVSEYPLQDGSCTGCYFENETETCEFRASLLGDCRYKNRADKKNVIFIEVKE